MRSLLRLLPVLVLCSLLSLPFSANCQAPIREARATAIVQQCLLKMGGAVPGDLVATGTVEITEGSSVESGTIRILFRGTDQAAEFIQTPEGQRSIVFSRGKAGAQPGRPSVNASPAPANNEKDRPISMESGLSQQPLYFPLAILRDALANPEFAIEEVKDAETSGGQHHVRIKNSFVSKPKLKELGDATAKEVWIDPTSGLPSKFTADMMVARGNAPHIPIEVSFTDYRDVGGVLFPFHIEVSINGTPWRVIKVERVALNTGLTDSDFPTNDGRPQ